MEHLRHLESAHGTPAWSHPDGRPSRSYRFQKRREQRLLQLRKSAVPESSSLSVGTGAFIGPNDTSRHCRRDSPSKSRHLESGPIARKEFQSYRDDEIRTEDRFAEC